MAQIPVDVVSKHSKSLPPACSSALCSGGIAMRNSSLISYWYHHDGTASKGAIVMTVMVIHLRVSPGIYMLYESIKLQPV